MAKNLKKRIIIKDSNLFLKISIYLVINIVLSFKVMAEKRFSVDNEEDDEWNDSKITGYKFDDDDETPYKG